MIERSYYDSFGLVVDGCKQDEKCPVVLHINFWVNRPTDCDLDFGICLPTKSEAKRLGLYIPFAVDVDEVTDLWDTFISSEVAQVVYNTSLESRPKKDGKTIRIVLERPGVPSIVNLCKLPAPSCGLSAIQCFCGCVLQIEVPTVRAKGGDLDTYIGFRFRIPYKPAARRVDRIAAYQETIASPVVSHRLFASIEVNEHRGLPPDIRRQVARQRVVIQQASIAVVSRSKWPVNVVEGAFRVRPLESDVWESYQPKLKEGTIRRHLVPRRWLVYQWRKSRGDKTSFQFEWSRKGVNAPSLLFYLVLYFLLGILSELLIRWVFMD